MTRFGGSFFRSVRSRCCSLVYYSRKRGEHVKNYEIRPAEFDDIDSIASVLLQTVPSLSELTAWVERENTIGRRFYERHAFLVVDEKEENFFGIKTHLLQYALYRVHD